MTMRFPRAAGALCAVVLAAAATAQEKGPHGAATSQAQLAALGKLVPDDAKFPPAGVDSVLWNATLGQSTTPDRVALGRRLFFDPRLSRSGKVSCATCHDVTRSFGDARPVSEGIGGKLGRRNAPTVMNAALIKPLFWDGRSPTLAHQAGQPILNPVEMGMRDEASVISKLRETDDYAETFKKTFGRDIQYEDIGLAIAAFEATLMFLDAPIDRFLAGDTNAISEDAKKGWELFHGKARCAACHPINATNPLGTDFRFHNIGVSAHDKNFEALAVKALKLLAEDSSEQALDRLAVATDLSELGRFMITKNPADIGAFRTPQLRNIGITQPYMHDGSMQTLWDVMDHYNKGGEVNAHLDGGIEALALSEQEIDQIVAMMSALTDDRFAALNSEQLKLQRERARTTRPFRDDALAQRSKLGFEDRVMGKGDNR